MDYKNFANFLLTVVVIAQILALVFIYHLYGKHGNMGFLVAVPILFFLYVFLFYAVKKIKITKNGRPIHLWTIFGDLIGMTIAIALSSLIIMFSGMFYIHRSVHNKMFVIIPIVSTAILYGALALSSEVL